MDEIIERVLKQFKNYPSITRHTIDAIFKEDPSNNKQLSTSYLPWILRCLVSGQELRFSPDGTVFEDGPKLFRALSLYQKFKASGRMDDYKDINQIKSFGDLVHILDEKGDYISRKYKVIKPKQDAVDASGLKNVLSSGVYDVYEITDYDSAQPVLCAPNSQWCVRYKEHFDNYNISKKNPIWVILKNSTPYVLFSGLLGQAKTLDDSPLGPSEMTELAPLFAQIYQLGIPIEYRGDFKLLFRNPAFRQACPEAMNNLAELPNESIAFAQDIGQRFPAGEPAIMENPYTAVRYARDVLYSRWPEAEPSIIQRPDAALEYASTVVKGRWPECEANLLAAGAMPDGRISFGPSSHPPSRGPDLIFSYAYHVLHGRWPEGEAVLLSMKNCDAKITTLHQYATYVIKGRWPEAEEQMRSAPVNSNSQYYLCLYALRIMLRRMPEFDPIIFGDNENIGNPDKCVGSTCYEYVRKFFPQNVPSKFINKPTWLQKTIS